MKPAQPSDHWPLATVLGITGLFVLSLGLYPLVGKAYFPRFEGELPEIFQDIGQSIRNEYALAYHPSNPKLDGSYRKLKVEIVGPDGQPLKVTDQKGKDVKYQVIAREGYTAKHQVD